MKWSDRAFGVQRLLMVDGNCHREQRCEVLFGEFKIQSHSWNTAQIETYSEMTRIFIIFCIFISFLSKNHISRLQLCSRRKEGLTLHDDAACLGLRPDSVGRGALRLLSALRCLGDDKRDGGLSTFCLSKEAQLHSRRRISLSRAVDPLTDDNLSRRDADGMRLPWKTTQRVLHCILGAPGVSGGLQGPLVCQQAPYDFS